MPIKNKACLPLCRLGEPAFMPKAGRHFELTCEHLAPRFRNICEDLLRKFDAGDGNQIPLKPIKFPNLTFVRQLKRNACFSVFNDKHQEYAKALIRIFDTANDIDELLSLALFVRDQVNVQLFLYAYSLTLAHRYEGNYELPHLFEIYPQKFFDADVMQTIYNKTNPTTSRKSRATEETVEIPFHGTMAPNNPEAKMAFYREDLAVNSHHWHWHLVYPIDGPSRKYYDKDRRGELFYYMHHQMLNIYDCTRLAHRIPRVVPFNNFREPFDVGYYSKMVAPTTSQIIPPRQDNSYLRDTTRDTNTPALTVGAFERWRDRFYEAIDRGVLLGSDGKEINILGPDGINTLVNCVEPNALSIDLRYYGTLHNDGHNIISIMHDPESKYDEIPGVMADTATAMRDPAFYQWHKFLDEMFISLKDRLPPYTDSDLVFSDVNIQSLTILDKANQPTTELRTFWQESRVDLQHGLDFRASQPTYVSFTHLNHEEFVYSINVQNTNASAVSGTVRIYLIPIYDETHTQYQFEGGRKLAIELDRFPAKLNPGMNLIHRKSTESKLTIPMEQTFPTNQSDPDQSDVPPDDIKNYCGCGWPQHMLLPKGNVDGFPYRLFAMISDYNQDSVAQSASDGVCSDCYILCGLRDRKYPDKRAMGYPFDRISGDATATMDDFLMNRNNMIATQITIRHLDEDNVLVRFKP